MKREEMAGAIDETLAFNKLVDAYIRADRDPGRRQPGPRPRKTTDPQVIIITDHISLYPAELYEHGLKIITAATTRNHPNAVNPRIKSLNYLNNILAKIEATQAGCLEALMLNHKGELAECTGDNVFVVQHGKIHTPSSRLGHPRGHHPRRGHRAGSSGRPHGDRADDGPPRRLQGRRMLPDRHGRRADPGRRVRRPRHRDGRPGPITRELRQRFHTLVREER